MSDFNIIGGLSGSADGGAEVSQEALERAAEQARATARQARQDQKQEEKKKQQDDILARVIRQFLGNNRYQKFFLLIARLLARNIPSDFLLSILALIHRESAEILKAKEIVLQNPPLGKNSFPVELSVPLSQWTTLVFSVSVAQPHRVLETILTNTWEIDENLVALMTLTMKEFFYFKKFDVPEESITSFARHFLTVISNHLEKQIHEQNKLSATNT